MFEVLTYIFAVVGFCLVLFALWDMVSDYFKRKRYQAEAVSSLFIRVSELECREAHRNSRLGNLEDTLDALAEQKMEPRKGALRGRK